MAQTPSHPSIITVTLLNIRCNGCRSETIPPPVGEGGGTGLHISCAHCMPTLDLSPSHGSTFNEMFAHGIWYSGMNIEADDVKPQKDELTRQISESVFTLKDKERLREIEEVEDCFILEFNPYTVDTLSELKKLIFDEDSDDISISTEEQGEVACRDYPHPRHLCVTHPFNDTPPYIHCNMCYCYVCDVPAPCEQWTKQSTFFRHCEATPDIQIWRDLRNSRKRGIYATFDECFSKGEFCYQGNNNIITNHQIQGI